MHVCHVITSLESAGAQRILMMVCDDLRNRGLEQSIIVLKNDTELAASLRKAGDRVCILGMNGALDLPVAAVRLGRLLRKLRPDVVQTWLYHADLLGGVMSRLLIKAPVIWSVHHANAELHLEKMVTRWIVRLCAKLSRRIPQKVVYCSNEARSVHEEVGYAPAKGLVIQNGVDTSRFRPLGRAREEARAELGLPREAFLIGLIGRYHKLKGHNIFVEAARSVNRHNSDVCFVFAGAGTGSGNQALVGQLREAGLESRCFLMGERADIDIVTAALDLAVSASITESFGLTIAEAMACAVPVIATNLPATARLVGDAGWLVNANNHEELAEAVKSAIGLDVATRAAIGERGRHRVQAEFNALEMTKQYGELYRYIVDSVSA